MPIFLISSDSKTGFGHKGIGRNNNMSEFAHYFLTHLHIDLVHFLSSFPSLRLGLILFLLIAF